MLNFPFFKSCRIHFEITLFSGIIISFSDISTEQKYKFKIPVFFNSFKTLLLRPLNPSEMFFLITSSFKAIKIPPFTAKKYLIKP